MTQERKQELTQLLRKATAPENLEIRQRSPNSTPLPPIDIRGYRTHLRQYWKAYVETSLGVVMTYEPNIVNEGVKSKLLDFIRLEFAPFIDEDKILSASFFLIGGVLDGFSPRFPLDYLLIQLLKITIAYGIEEAASTFDKCTKETQGSFQHIILLDGIRLKRKINIFEGIRLIPLPRSTSGLPYYLRNHLPDVPKDFFSGKTLLVVDCSVSPIFHKPFRASTMQEYEDQLNRIFRAEIDSKDFPNLKTDDFPLNLLCQALSLACHSEVKTFFFARFFPEDTLYNLSYRMRVGGSRTRPRLGDFPEVGQPEIEEAKRLYKILYKILFELNQVGLNSKDRKKLQIVIGRWIKSTANKDIEDKIIDLVIAFEALYLPDAGESTFKLAVRASWHLGSGKEDRKKLLTEFKELYKCRSAVVHGGELKESVTIEEDTVPMSELIKKSQDRCRESIEKIMKHCLKQGEFPKNNYWDNLILG